MAIFLLTQMQTLKHTTRWLVLLLFVPSFVMAEETAFELSLYTEARQVQRGQPFEISVSLKQASDQPLLKVGDLTLNGMSGFKEIGQSTSVNTQVLDGKTAFFAEISKTLIATKAGTFQIGPASMPVKDPDGKDLLLESKPVEIIVTDVPPTTVTPPPTATPIIGGQLPDTPPDPDTKLPEEPTQTTIQTDESSNLFFWGQLLALLTLGGLVYSRWYKKTMAYQMKAKAIEPLTRLAKIKPNQAYPKINDPELLSKARNMTHDFYFQIIEVDPSTMTTEEIIITAREQMPEKKLQELLEVLQLHDAHRFSGQPVDGKALTEALKKLFTV